MASTPTTLLTYTVSTTPSPLEISTDTPTPGLVTVAVASNPDVLCRFIVIKVPIGDLNDDLYRETPAPTISSSSADWAPTLEEAFDASVQAAPRNYHTFTLANNTTSHVVDQPVTFTIKGVVNASSGSALLPVAEYSAPVSSPTYSSKVASFPLPKAAAPAFYVRNFISSAPDTPTVPATEFINATKFLLAWESNGTYFKVYQKGQTTPVYEGNATSYLVEQGLPTDTTFVLAATLKDATLYQTLTVTVRNPSLTPHVVGIGGPSGFRLANTNSNVIGADGYGGNIESLAWATGQNGYVGQFFNGAGGGSANGVVIKVASTSATALDVSQGVIDQMGTPLLRVSGTGKVGIGITTPAYALDVNGVVNAHQEIRSTAVISNAAGSLSQFGPNDAGFYYEAGGTMQFVAGGHRWMMLNTQGSMGLGTGSPVAKLHVNGNAGEQNVQGVANWFSYNWVGANNTLVHDAGASGQRPLAAYFEGGEVWVNGSIVSGTVSAASDARIKRVVGPSDCTADLARLQQLQITDYAYIDQANNPAHTVKKVIAQQVQQVYPEAVSRHTGAIPNVYEPAASLSHAAGYLTVRTTRPHELPAAGGRMRLYTPQGQDLHVEASVVDEHTFRFASEQPHEALFVYGKYVADFLSVDYDALAMLNVSATQALIQQNAALQAQAERQQARLDQLQGALEELQAQMATLLGGIKVPDAPALN
ncbi:tail fiber domain-containing protein [Hymenobacter aquaticus]|uniref:Tail fiber domain-containing protein n=1 Tax=Hymenobacter aquaticus TaxID=1867101 RepID=A0A4Z0Q6M2_9BACT|nr:tail fiber domain-containing protein [Hymenobacter aquaticus]TGE24332.1 tail fiber domain-containing protein [Hymenobacter aquaticus]